MIVACYVPTFFGLAFLGSAYGCKKAFGDKKGICNGIFGMVCLGMAIGLTIAVAKKSTDICRLLSMARMGMSGLAVPVALLITVFGGSRGLGYSALYFFYAVAALPELYLMTYFVTAIDREKRAPPQQATVVVVPE